MSKIFCVEDAVLCFKSLRLIANNPKIPDLRKRRQVLLLHLIAMLMAIPFFPWIRTNKRRLVEEPRRILLIRTDRIGDFVMTTPIFGPLRERFPDASISLLCRPSVLPFANLFVQNGTLSEVISHDPDTLSIRQLRGLIKSLRSRQFDLAIDLRGDFRQALMAFASRALRRVGFAQAGFDFLLTDVINESHLTHQAEEMVLIAKRLGAKGKIFPTLPISPQKAADAEAALVSKGATPGALRIALHMSASCSARRWDSNNFIAVAQKLSELHPANFIILGGREDISDAQLFADRVPGSIVTAGAFSLEMTAALLSVCDLMVGNDSGPAHIASAVGCPVVVLFGPGNAEVTRPRGERVTVLTSPRPCDYKCDLLTCAVPGRHCLAAISPESVIQAAEMALSSGKHGFNATT